MADTSVINFKSVGTMYSVQKELESESNNIPIAIKIPMTVGSNNELFAVTFSLRETIKQNLRNLILTNHGERLGNFFYGANLRPLTMEHGVDDFDNAVASNINTAVGKWMSFIELTEMKRSVEFVDQNGMSKVKLRIFYNVPSVNIKNEAIDVILYVAG